MTSAPMPGRSAAVMPTTTALANDARFERAVRRSLELARAGRHDRAITVLTKARDEARAAALPEIEAQILSTIVFQAFLAFDLERSRHAADEIVELARRPGLDPVLSRAIAFRGHLTLARYHCQLGLDAEAKAALDKAEELGAIQTPTQLCGFLELRAIVTAKTGDGVASASIFDQLLDISSRRDPIDNYACRLSSAGGAALITGLVDRSLHLYETALERAAMLGPDNRIYNNVAVEYAWAALTGGRLRMARHLLDRSGTLDDSLPVRIYRAAADLMLAALGGGTPAAAPDVEAFSRACDGRIPNQIGPIAAALHAFYIGRAEGEPAQAVLSKALDALLSPDGCWWLLLQAAAHGTSEDRRRALALLTPCAPGFRLGKALRLLLEGRNSDRAAWDASLIFGELGWPYHRAVALQLAGRTALAREHVAKLGVARGVRLVSPVLPHRRVRSAYHVALSGLDREIVRLVCDEATNRAIGLALGMSERAVTYHLTEIFAAYGVRNRRELARCVRQNGHDRV